MVATKMANVIAFALFCVGGNPITGPDFFFPIHDDLFRAPLLKIPFILILIFFSGTRGWIIKVDGGVPPHVARGDFAELRCEYHLAPRHALYALKWYKDGKEFYRFIPMDDVRTQTFPMPGINVDVSRI